MAEAWVIYLSGGHPRVLPEGLGEILVPGQRNKARSIWAADNGCFARPQDYNDDKYLHWLGKRKADPFRCLFATAPDVMGQAEATLERSLPMLGRIREVGYPAALVGQDGMTPDMLPWDLFDALFIGGTTEWKLGQEAAVLAAAALAHNKLVHMGRVNSKKRMRYAASIGCFSVDGTALAFNLSLGEKFSLWSRQITEEYG